MASGALFGSNVGGRSQSKNLLECKAGKMYLKGKMCHPDKRKGLMYIYQSDDSLMHFCWKERNKTSVEDDLIIFPDDTEYKHVPQCTTGRVFVLKFKSSNRKFIFWMQEPKSDKDEELCRKVNDLLNNPPTPGSSRGAGAGSGGLSNLPPELAGLGESDLQSILGNMSQQQLMQLLGGMGGYGGLSSMMAGRPASAQSTDSNPPLRVQSSPGPRASDSATPQPPRPATAAVLPTGASSQQSVTTPTQPVNPTPNQAIQLSDLQSILSNMNVPGSQSEAIDLSQALSPDIMIPILANPDIQQQLMSHLPEGESLPRNEQELRNTISSPQFQQAMSSFSAALASGQLGPLMAQFGLGEDVANAAAQGDVEAFVRAMQAQNEKKEEPPTGDKQ